jgi:hypothetical protein
MMIQGMIVIPCKEERIVRDCVLRRIEVWVETDENFELTYTFMYIRTSG